MLAFGNKLQDMVSVHFHIPDAKILKNKHTSQTYSMVNYGDLPRSNILTDMK